MSTLSLLYSSESNCSVWTTVTGGSVCRAFSHVYLRFGTSFSVIFSNRPSLAPEYHLGRAQRRRDVETGRPFRRADLGVVLRGRAGRIVNDLDAELLLEGLDDVLLEELLVFAAETVDDQRFVGTLAPDIGRAETDHGGSRGAPDEFAPIEFVLGSVLCRHDRLLFASVQPARQSSIQYRPNCVRMLSQRVLGQRRQRVPRGARVAPRGQQFAASVRPTQRRCGGGLSSP